MRRHVIRFSLAALLLISVSAAADPPERAVRLNLTDGLVSFRPAGIDEWTDAMVNRPLIEGDELWTTESSRAELHIGSAAVRLSSSTSLGIVAATDRIAQLRLTSGAVNVHVRSFGEDDVWEIDTPNAVVSLLRAGRYRIEVSDGGLLTGVTTWNGEAQVSGGDSSFLVRSGDFGQVSGEYGGEHDVWEAPDPDGFDRWCNGRDDREERVAALHYVPRDLVGYEDLDEYGSWRFVNPYGWVWQPVVTAGWAPYRHGCWTWIEPWGWTWMDSEPWGFAPFHYGRWAYVGGGWAWVPGELAHPIYAPALVVFGASGQWGNVVAWWPLAPGEVYVPAYHAGHRYVRDINAPTVNVMKVDVTKVDVRHVRYANQTVANAVTAVLHDNFNSGRPITRSTVVVSAADAKPLGVTAPVAPRLGSVIGSVSGARAAKPPEAIVSRRVVARTAPPPAPIPFTVKQQVLAQDPGKPLDPTASERLRVRSTTPPPKIQVIDKLPVQEKPRTKAIQTPETTTTTPPPPIRKRTTPPAVTTTIAPTPPPATTTAPPPEPRRRTIPPAVTTTIAPTPPPTTTTAPPPEPRRRTVHTPPPQKTTTTSTSETTSTTETPKPKPKPKTKREEAEEKKKDQ